MSNPNYSDWSDADIILNVQEATERAGRYIHELRRRGHTVYVGMSVTSELSSIPVVKVMLKREPTLLEVAKEIIAGTRHVTSGDMDALRRAIEREEAKGGDG